MNTHLCIAISFRWCRSNLGKFHINTQVFDYCFVFGLFLDTGCIAIQILHRKWVQKQNLEREKKREKHTFR